MAASDRLAVRPSDGGGQPRRQDAVSFGAGPGGVGLAGLLGSVRAALGAISTVWLASMIAAVAGLGAQLLVAPHLGPRDYGAFAAALATVGLAAPLAPFGIAPFWLKLFGQEGAAARRWVPASLRLAGLTSAGACLALAVLAAVLAEDRSTLLILAGLVPFMLFRAPAELAGAVFQLEDRFLSYAILQAAPSLLRLALALAVVAFDATLGQLVLGYFVLFALLNLATLTTVARLARGRMHLAKDATASPAGPVEPPSVATLFRLTSPFAIHTALYMVYYQIDIVLLDYLKGPEPAGNYYIAFSCLMVATLVPATVFQRYLLPRLHHWSEHDRGKIVLVYRLGMRWMLALGTVAMVGMIGVGLLVLPWAFGEEYHAAGEALAALAVVLPIHFCAACLSALLLTRDNISRKIRLDVAGLAFNVAANLLLIPFLSILGAVIACILSELLLLVLYRSATMRHVLQS